MAFTEDIFINEMNPPSRNSQVSASVFRGHPGRCAIQFRLENLAAKQENYGFSLTCHSFAIHLQYLRKRVRFR